MSRYTIQISIQNTVRKYCIVLFFYQQNLDVLMFSDLFSTIQIINSNLILSSNINEQTKEELLSPLMIAVNSKHTDFVDELLKLDAKIDLVDRCGNTVYHHAVQNDPSVIEVSSQLVYA